MKKILFVLSIIASLSVASLMAQDTVRVSNTVSGTWDATKVYVLEGYVRVDNGDTLVIPAGTVVLADTGSQENASAMIIERNGYLDAQGTASNPIIFSSVLDDVNDPSDLLDVQARGLWGGIIMCGDASTNTADNGNEQVEGIPSTLPASVGTFGGSVDNDNSGILRYVSIRHTGVALASNNEIQGLTLAGVGNGTTIEYVESYASDDDGIEIFGGTVNMKNIAIIFAADDMLDLDQGYRGKLQNVFIMQAADFGDRMGEWDGADSPEDGMPFAGWVISNMTMIGRRPVADDRAITFRANGRGQVWSSVIIEQTRGVDIEISGPNLVSTNSYDGFTAGTTAFSTNVFDNVADGTAEGIFKVTAKDDDNAIGGWNSQADSTAAVDAAAVAWAAHFAAAGNVATDAQIGGVTWTNDGGNDPRFYAPEITNNVTTPADPFFDVLSYKGAFNPGPGGLWIRNWTAFDHYGYLTAPAAAGDTITVTGTVSGEWNAANIYKLQGYVRIADGDTLVIPAGTVVLADTGSQEAASALIVERGAYIDARGTAQSPIIFTSCLDNTNDPTDLLDVQAKGLWGGIIMCGSASTNTADNGNEQVEGIPSTLPATVGVFGGTNDADNSGILRYVSIRHTGVALASNNEIQGLTLAGVGSGTTIEFVESYASDDDGIEIFGGTVNMKNIVIAFAADDMLDLDQGYRGKIQNIYIHQAADFGDRCGEWDGADSPEDGTPTSAWVISNMTIVGRRPVADDRLITFRANGRGQVWNSIMIEQQRGVDIEISGPNLVSTSSYDGFTAGTTAFANNIFFNVADGTAEEIFKVTAKDDDNAIGGWDTQADSTAAVDAAITAWAAHFAAGGNIAKDPQINGLSWMNDGGLDPRFADWEVTHNLGTINDPFFTATNYKGAFSQLASEFWAKGWTAMDHYGYFAGITDDVFVSNEEIAEESAIKAFPNPTTGIVNVVATDIANGAVINVYDMTGRTVYSAVHKAVAGELNAKIDLSNENAGLYIIAVESNGKTEVSRVVLK
ncbi:MAG: T9SS type A sorting domain-containing protein [Bacteroidota bacterium]